jgi:hypothetical protein
MLKMPALIREWKAVCVLLQMIKSGWTMANMFCRSGGRTGPNGPNKEQGPDGAVLDYVRKCNRNHTFTDLYCAVKNANHIGRQATTGRVTVSDPYVTEALQILPSSCVHP